VYKAISTKFWSVQFDSERTFVSVCSLDSFNDSTCFRNSRFSAAALAAAAADAFSAELANDDPVILVVVLGLVTEPAPFADEVPTRITSLSAPAALAPLTALALDEVDGAVDDDEFALLPAVSREK
jgi:hypothetical protein